LLLKSDWDMISKATLQLEEYIQKENYKGYDPYDALRSPVFRLPFLKNSSHARFFAQQLVKRFPINLRPVLGIQKGTSPVTLALSIQAYSNNIFLFPEEKIKYEEKINKLIQQLEKLISPGFSGACWGYEFDWESRYAKIPAYGPTVVATGFVTNALFNLYRATGNKKALELCVSSTRFILNNLNRTYDEANQNFCFSYSPFDHEMVFNASMKGARTLAQVYSVTKDEPLKTEAQKAVAYVMNHQNENGSWIYSKRKTGGWIDNYHTGYVLDCLDEYGKCTGDKSFQAHLEKGFSFYKNNFFTEEGIPKFYDRKTYPVDCTAAGQSLLTLTRFGETEKAGKVAVWMIKNMQAEKGYFYFRKHRNYTDKTSFMRWSNAWMFVGLTELGRKMKK